MAISSQPIGSAPISDHPDPYKQLLQLIAQSNQMVEVLGKQAHASTALVMCARLEKTVQMILETKMPKLSKTQSNRLFEDIKGPLNTFYAKIEVAYSLGLIDHQEKIILHAIRDIRNKFAHADEETHFDSLEVAKKMAKLPDTDDSTNFSRFLTVSAECSKTLADKLNRYWLVKSLRDGTLKQRSSPEKSD